MGHMCVLTRKKGKEKAHLFCSCGLSKEEGEKLTPATQWDCGMKGRDFQEGRERVCCDLHSFFAKLQSQGPWGVINKLKRQPRAEELFLFCLRCCGKTSRLVDCVFHIVTAMRIKWALRPVEAEGRPEGLFSTCVTWIWWFCLASLLGISGRWKRKYFVTETSRAETWGQTKGELQWWYGIAKVRLSDLWKAREEITAAINLTCTGPRNRFCPISSLGTVTSIYFPKHDHANFRILILSWEESGGVIWTWNVELSRTNRLHKLMVKLFGHSELIKQGYTALSGHACVCMFVWGECACMWMWVCLIPHFSVSRGKRVHGEGSDELREELKKLNLLIWVQCG